MNQAVLHRILWARALRAFGDGYVSLLLPVYLTVLGMDPFQIGMIATGTLSLHLKLQKLATRLCKVVGNR